MWLDYSRLQLTSSNPLATLRDIRVPDAISWWPPALGWWVLSLAATACLLVLVVRTRRYWRSPGRAAVRELAIIRKSFRLNGDPNALAVALSIFLRRCVLAKFPPQDVAGLTGTAWLEFLDKTGETRAFTAGPGRVLISAPYQACARIQADQLLCVIAAWIERALSTEESAS